MEKIVKLFSSVRFQQLVIALVLILLGFYKIIPQELANILAGFFGVSITVGTIDKTSASIGNKTGDK